MNFVAGDGQSPSNIIILEGLSYLKLIEFFFFNVEIFHLFFYFFFSSNDELLWLLLSSTYIFFVSIVFQPPSRVMKFNENQVGSSKNGSLVSSHLFQLTVPSVFALLFFDV